MEPTTTTTTTPTTKPSLIDMAISMSLKMKFTVAILTLLLSAGALYHDKIDDETFSRITTTVVTIFSAQ